MPLHSTREQVERILGNRNDRCDCYKVDNASVYVEYALAPCKGRVSGWNVPTDTVLKLTVRPSDPQRFADLKLDLTNYSVRRDDTFTTYYASRNEGLEYQVSTEGVVSAVSYIPSSGNDHLRCDGFPRQDASITDFVAFDEFGDLDVENEEARLDNYAVALQSSGRLDGYVVVYAGPVACPHEAWSRANRARRYLINKRGLAPSRLTAIDGGHREEFLVRLYAVPPNGGPPNLFPTIASTEARVVRNKRCVKRNETSPCAKLGLAKEPSTDVGQLHFVGR